MGLFRGAVFHRGGHPRKQPIKQPVETPTSTLALMTLFRSVMGLFRDLNGLFTEFVLRGSFPSWKSRGKQPIKKRPTKRFLSLMPPKMPICVLHSVSGRPLHETPIMWSPVCQLRRTIQTKSGWHTPALFASADCAKRFGTRAQHLKTWWWSWSPTTSGGGQASICRGRCSHQKIYIYIYIQK